MEDEYIPPELRPASLRPNRNKRVAFLKPYSDPGLVSVSVLMALVSIVILMLVSIPAGVILLLLSDIPALCANRWRCDSCRNRVDGKQVRLCPACHAALQLPPSQRTSLAVIVGLAIGIPVVVIALVAMAYFL